MVAASLNLLIVDDEENMIKTILNGIDWGELGFAAVSYAYDTIQAKEWIANNPVDLLLSDIEMPGGTGLDLLEWINANGYDIRCIFMTCHADFSYAQKAVKLGGVDYILKPLDFSALTEAFRQTCLQIHVSRKTKQTVTFWEESRQDIIRQFWNDLFIGDIAPNMESITAYKQKKHISYDTSKRFCPIFIKIQAMPEDVQRKNWNLLAYGLRNMASELFETEHIRHEVMAFGGTDTLIMLSFEIGMDEAAVEARARECSNQLIDAALRHIHIQICAYVGKPSGICDVPDQIALLQLEDYEKAKTTKENPVDQVMKYIDTHIADDFTMEDIAESIHLSVNYLNRAFKQKAGISLGQYAIKKKMERAAWLLRNTDLPVGDIAEQVGYSNYSSFYRIFGRVTGMSPQKYKSESTKR